MLDWIQSLDRINKWAGKGAGWCGFFMVLIICTDVLMRYFFGFTLIWVMEIEIYFFAFMFLLGAGYTFQLDKHVRVDVIYNRLSDRQKAWVNIWGTLFFLMPWTLVIMWVSYNYAYMSFIIGEKSPQPGGLPALYILKFSVFLGFALLFLQGLSNLMKDVFNLLDR